MISRINLLWLARCGAVSAVFALGACVSGGGSDGSGSSASTAGTEFAAASVTEQGADAQGGEGGEGAEAAGRMSATAVNKSVINGPYVIQSKSNLVIENVRVYNPNGQCIKVLSSSNITIRNAEFLDCKGVGVEIQNSSNIRVEDSYFQNLNGGVYAYRSSTIKVNRNRFKNVDRRKYDQSRGQFVQFNGVTGTGNEINQNRGINEPNLSHPEDLVNLFQSSGTAASPIQVLGNCFKGGGPSTSGGGIMLGDAGGSYSVVRENTLVDVGQYGIAIASGQNHEISSNRVFGRKQTFTNVGMYVWNQYSPACNGHKVYGNQIDFTNAKGQKNPMWNANNCGAVTGWSQNTTNVNLSALTCTL